MKHIAIAILLAAALPAAADQYVRPHVRNDGTYVEGHMRSAPNNTRYDNYSAQGNSNPYTGERGSQRSELSDTPAYNGGRGNSGYVNPYDSGASRGSRSQRY